MPIWRIFCVVLCLFGLAPQALFSQNHTLTASTGSGLPGSVVTASVTLDNDEGARGFSMGMAHSGTFLTLQSITPGTATANSNSGAGPEFQFTDVVPANGPGGTYGVILSLSAPLDEIPVGTGNEIALFNYSCSAAANPGSSEILSFSDVLGTPSVSTVISVVVGATSVSRIPNVVSGSISVENPAPTNLSCSMTSPCGGNGVPPHGEGTLTWTNGGTYDAVEVFANGALVQNLAGTATSTTFSPAGTGTGQFFVRGVRNATTSADSNTCSLNFQPVDPPQAPTGVSCSVNQATGETTVSWSNSGTVTAVNVTLDGVLVDTLGAGATSTTVTIGGPGSYGICVSGANQCGEFGAEACCTAVRDNFFVRNDMNQDGNSNIADPVALLNFLFGSGTLLCMKSGDVNDDGTVNIADVVYSLNVIFGIPASGGSVPTVPAPDGTCGPDPTPDSLTCDSFAC
ncbi:MAG: dockerin type I repeat-containing protein [Planctomycetota bacterium]|nr:dockerin type I repeat-containing protein [Planctomycetota bacterium]